MLKRNKVLVAFMLVAVLCMSIGFAAISDTLTASGELGLNVGEGGALNQGFDEDVFFSVASFDNCSNGATSGVTAAVDNDDKDLVNINIDNTVFKAVGDTVTVKATIRNEGEVAANLAVTPTSSTNTTVTATLANSATSVGAGDTIDLTIVVELKSNPSENVTGEKFSVAVVATPAN